MIQILFLDFDGVINNTPWSISEARRFNRALARVKPGADWKSVRASADFDPANLAQLAAIVQRLPALSVVVSSSWRKGRTLAELRELLQPAVPSWRVVGATPSDDSRLRFVEIRQWLAACPTKVDRFLALDDDTFDMHQLGADFLHVHRARGLTPAHVEQVVAHFAARSPHG